MSIDPKAAPNGACSAPSLAESDHAADLRRRRDDAADVLADGLLAMLLGNRGDDCEEGTQPRVGAVENA